VEEVMAKSLAFGKVPIHSFNVDLKSAGMTEKIYFGGRNREEV
jgi:hypothetical protein